MAFCIASKKFEPGAKGPWTLCKLSASSFWFLLIAEGDWQRVNDPLPIALARSGRELVEVPRPKAGVLRLLFLFRGVYCGLNHVLVLLEPRLGALDRVIVRRG